MTDAARTALTDTWLLACRLGSIPTNATVCRFVREAGIAFGDREAKKLLSALRAAPGSPLAAPEPPLELRTFAPGSPLAAPEPPLEGGSKSVAFSMRLDDRVRAAKDLVGVDDLETQAVSGASAIGGGEAAANATTSPPPGASLPLGVVGTQTALLPLSKPTHRRRTEPTAEQLAGWAIRDAIAGLVAPHLRAMTLTAWKAAWSRTALDMARAGVTPEAAVAAWEAHYERTGTRLFKLSALQDRMVIEATAQPEDPLAGVHVDFTRALYPKSAHG